MFDLKKYKNIYMIGIGGISMSGIAHILNSWNFKVSGSNNEENNMTDELNNAGIKVYIPHNYNNITNDIDLVVYTAAIKEDNPELVHAHELNIKTFERGEFLGELVSTDTKKCTETYELKLPSDHLFTQVHGEVKLRYIVYKDQNVVMLETIEPRDILLEGHVAELTTYKGVMISKANADKDKFMVNLFSAMDHK